MKQDVFSWGNYPRTTAESRSPFWVPESIAADTDGAPILAHGLGRSYGDTCLNHDGVLLRTEALDRFLAFDRKTGILRCEAGTSLARILPLILPAGWFLPVSPGTKFVTLGGAVANDIHGKNHHVAGTFGRHVRAFELLRSNGERLICAPDRNQELFRATIGGLGLTGLMTWVEIGLIPAASPWIKAERLPFRGLDAFFEATAASDTDFAYTVAWLDLSGRDATRTRGIFFRGNHCTAPEPGKPAPRRTQLSVPFHAMAFLLNSLSIKCFNGLYHWSQSRGSRAYTTDYDAFFFPLDRLRNWNRLYGKRGFLQYQCVVPGREPLAEILSRCGRGGLHSFLTVLKKFGSLPSPGLLSFPIEGFTLAMDIPFNTKTLEILDELDRIVAAAGGRVYPAKDARMSPSAFRTFYPHWQELEAARDPAFSSSFWRRVTATTTEDTAW